jgi:hypothetical protein
MATRRELKQVIGERYRMAGRWERRQMLDEFIRVTGYHRKHALRVLNRPFVAQLVRKRPRIYGEAVHQALTLLWEAADRICGKRLKPLLPVLIESMERHGHLRLDPVVRSAPGAGSTRKRTAPALGHGFGDSAERAGANL